MKSTIYVKQQGAVMTRSGERIIVKRKKDVLADVPAINVDQVVIYGNAQLTTPLVSFLLEKGIDTVFLSQRGRYKGRLQTESSKDVTLRQRQFQLASDRRFCLSLSKKFVAARIENAIQLCRRRDRSGLGRKIQRLEGFSVKVSLTSNLDSLRGYEGTSARIYYQALRGMLKHNMGFNGRTKRPPRDPVNVLLSLGYTLLFKDIHSLVNLVGFDPYQGFFHQSKEGHPTLVSDLMEEFRTPIVDLVVLSALNRQTITPKNFRIKNNGSVRLDEDGFSKFAEEYRGRLDTRVKYPLSGQQITHYQVLEEQVRHLARVILGKDYEYTPFRLRS